MLIMASLVSILLLLRKIGLDMPWMDKLEYNLKSKILETSLKRKPASTEVVEKFNINTRRTQDPFKTNTIRPYITPTIKVYSNKLKI